MRCMTFTAGRSWSRCRSSSLVPTRVWRSSSSPASGWCDCVPRSGGWSRSSSTWLLCATERVSRTRRSPRSSAPSRGRSGCACTGFLKSYDGGFPMTTEQLERDLETLAEPRQGDERLRLEIRARLGEQMLARPPRRVRPRPRRRFGWAVAAAAVAAMAAVVVSLGSPGGSGGPSVANAAIIRHALRAISSPANAIVHVKEIGVQDGTTVGAEWWQETSAPHALRMIKGPVGGQREGASDGSTSFQYDARTNTIVETPNSSAPALVDPIAPVREQLARGDAQV